MTGKTVAITGATGFLGRHVVTALLKAGYKPIAIVRDPISARKIFNNDVEIRKANILDPEVLMNAFKGADFAIHLAGKISVNKCDDDEIREANIIGTKNFIKAVESADIKRALFTSTTSAVGALDVDDKNKALNENSFFNLTSENISYIQSKRKAHVLALDAQDKDLPIIILSPSFVIGPEDINSNTSTLIDIISHGKLPVYPIGGINPIDVRDVAECFLKAIEHPNPSQHYILASEQNLTLKQLVKCTAKLSNARRPSLTLPNWLTIFVAKIIETFIPKGKLTEDSARLGKYYWYFDASLARQELNLSCRPLEKTITDTLSWLKARQPQDIRKLEQ